MTINSLHAAPSPHNSRLRPMPDPRLHNNF